MANQKVSKDKEVKTGAAAQVRPVEKKKEAIVDAPDKEAMGMAGKDVVKHKIAVVFYYDNVFYKLAQLELAIRSWKRFFCDRFDLYVIGDEVKIDGVISIPMKPDKRFGRSLANALNLAVMEDNISKEFIFTLPDIFLVNAICTDYIRIPKFAEFLKADDATLVLLRGAGFFTAHSYSGNTGTPVLVDKDIFIALSGVLALDMTDVFTPLVYAHAKTLPVHLQWRTDPWLLPVVSDMADTSLFDQLAPSKCFVSNRPDAWTERLRRRLEKIIG